MTETLLLLKDLATQLPQSDQIRVRAFEKFIALYPQCFREDPLPLFEKGKKLTLAKENFSAPVSGDVDKEEDLWALLNMAFCEEEKVFDFTESRQEKRYEMRCLSSKNGALFSPRLLLRLKPHCHLHFIFDEEGSQSPSFVNSVIEIQLAEGASCIFTHLDKNSPALTKRLLMRVHLAKESQFRLEVIGEGACFSRKKYETMLNGDFAEASLSGLFLLSNKSVERLSSHLYHRAKSTCSNQHFRSSLFQESRFDCRGSVRMEKEAVFGSAHQICRSLLLSDSAQATLEPFLEINADEVKASHGAALGKISEDELFYLRARGIKEKRAKELLTLAFMRELLLTFSTAQIREEAERIVRKIYGD